MASSLLYCQRLRIWDHPPGLILIQDHPSRLFTVFRSILACWEKGTISHLCFEGYSAMISSPHPLAGVISPTMSPVATW